MIMDLLKTVVISKITDDEEGETKEQAQASLRRLALK